MTIPTISTLPTAPARTDAPATFITRADAFLAALVTMQSELNTSIGAMNTDIGGIAANVTAAQAAQTAAELAETNAEAAQAAAEAASNATLWVSGTSYSSGDVVYSPVDYKSYRANTATSGTTDPSASADWTKLAYALPSQSGNAGKYLTTDGSNESWGDISASPTLDAVASGALSNGDKVIINSDGTVSVAAEVPSTTPVAGDKEVFNSGNIYDFFATYDSANEKVVIAFRDVSAGSGKAIVGSVDSATRSITFGSSVQFDSGSASNTQADYDSANEKIVIVYTDGNNSSYATAIVGTVSGTSISFGSSTVFNSVSSTNNSVAFDVASGKVVVSCKDGATVDGLAKVGTVSGTGISFGTGVFYRVGSVGDQRIVYDSTNEKIVIVFIDNAASDPLHAIVGTVSGTSISFGTSAVITTTSMSNNDATFDSGNGKIVVVYRDSTGAGGGAPTVAVGTVSGTSISFGTPVAASSANSASTSITYDASRGKIVVVYRDQSNSNYGTAVVGTVSGTSISFITPLVFASTNSGFPKLAYDSVNEEVVIAFRDGGNSNYGTTVVFSASSFETNLTSENYIGISSAAYSDSETATIQIIGSVDDAQSGLTAGQSYYVQTDGTLSETPADPSVFAGTAVSATKLIVKG